MADNGRGRKKRVAVLISGRGSNMTALIEASKAQAFPAEIALVLANHPDAGGLVHARAAGVATAVVDHAAHGKDREAFERAMQAVLETNRIDIVCLAGFMRLLTPWFVGHGPAACSHPPALLPAFKGLGHARARGSPPGSRFTAPACTSSSPRWIRARSSSGRRAGARRRLPRRWPPACSHGQSTASTRWRLDLVAAGRVRSWRAVA